MKHPRILETKIFISDCPIRIAFLSDTHNGEPEPILGILGKTRPDMILISGDITYGYVPKTSLSLLQQQKNILPLLCGCTSIAPTVCSLGNHDVNLREVDKRLLIETGIILLDNEWKVLNNGVIVGGLTSSWRPNFERKQRHIFQREYIVTEPKLEWLTDFCSLDGYKILLSHHPEQYERYLKDMQIDLILSGHAHGGQWRLFDHGLYAPGQGVWPKYTSGRHGNMIVSKGLANTVSVPRLNNPMEIVFLNNTN